MYYRQLIAKSEARMENVYVDNAVSPAVFSSGAKWMYEQLNALEKRKTGFDPSINFTFYGVLKYSISLAAFVIAAWLLYTIHLLLTPLAVFVFYFFEVQFLFLFPLLIDKVKRPVLASVQLTWRIGVVKCVFTVMPVALYMLIGLLDLSRPLHNWHVGCMAILIWYQDEISNRT